MCFLLTLFPMSVLAEENVVASGECGEYTTWLFEDGVLTISGTGSMYDYSIEKRPWDAYTDTIEKIIVEKGITSISDEAFLDCYNLMNVSLPETLESIGNSAFEMCSELTDIVLPDNLRSIGDMAFYSCDLIDKIKIPKNVTKIGIQPFAGCNNLTEVTVDEGNDKFYAKENTLYEKLTNGVRLITCITDAETFTIPDGVTILEKYAFLDAKNLKEIYIPSSVKHIRKHIFFEKRGTVFVTDIYYNGSEFDWDEIQIDSRNTTINNATIHFALETTDNPVSVEKSYVDVPSNVYSDTTLLSLKINLLDENGNPTTRKKDIYFWIEREDGTILNIDGNYRMHYGFVIHTNYEENYFSCYDAKNGIYAGISFLKPGTYKIYYSFEEPYREGNTLTSKNAIGKELKVVDNYNCGDGVTWSLDGDVLTISGNGTVTKGTWASYEDEIVTIILGDNVYISSELLSNVYYLQQFVVNESNENYSVIDGVLYNKDVTTLIMYPSGKKTSKYAMPETLKEIESVNSLLNAKFEILSIPASLVDSRGVLIDNMHSQNLKKFEVSVENISYASIDGVLFNKDKTILYSLPAKYEEKSYNIPDGTMYVSSEASWDGNDIETLFVPDTVIDLNYPCSGVSPHSRILYHYDSLKTVTVDNNNQFYSSQDGVLFNKAQSELLIYPVLKIDKTYAIPDSVINVGEEAFMYNKYLQKLIITENVKKFGDCALTYMYALQDIVVDENNNIFYSDDGILYQKHGDEIILIQYPIAKPLLTFSVPNGVTKIGADAFNASELQTIILSNSVAELGNCCFENCESLEKIYIPKTVTMIDEGVINFAIALKDVYFGGTKSQWKKMNVWTYWMTDIHFNATGIPKDNENTSSGSFASVSFGSVSLNSDTNNISIRSTDSSVILETSAVANTVINDVKSAVSELRDISMIGGSKYAVNIKATDISSVELNGFETPVSVSISINEILDLVDDYNHLTLAKVVNDAEGNITFVYMGGNYDMQSGLFNAYVDETGDYVLLEDDTIRKIVLQIGNKLSSINGEIKRNDVAPCIIDGHTYLPVRYIAEALGCDVNWEEATRTVMITQNGLVMQFVIDKEIEGYGLAAVIRENRTLIPIRYIAEMLNANVIWNADTYEVTIVKATSKEFFV